MVPSIQKKTGPVAADVKKEDAGSVAGEIAEEKNPKVSRKRKPATQSAGSRYFRGEAVPETRATAKKSRRMGPSIENTQDEAAAALKAEDDPQQGIDDVKMAKKHKTSSGSARKLKASESSGEAPTFDTNIVQRRSARSSRRSG